MIPAFKKGHNSNLSEEQRFFNTKLAKVCIKSEHCIGLLKEWFQHLQGFWWVIRNKSDLDAILKLTLCACILHNLLIEHPVPLDWFDDDIVELEQEDELNQSMENSTSDTRHNQVLDEWNFGTMDCYIYLNVHPSWGTLSEAYMYSPFAACGLCEKNILYNNQKRIY